MQAFCRNFFGRARPIGATKAPVAKRARPLPVAMTAGHMVFPSQIANCQDRRRDRWAATTSPKLHQALTCRRRLTLAEAITKPVRSHDEENEVRRLAVLVHSIAGLLAIQSMGP